MNSISDITKRGERLDVTVSAAYGTVATGEYWTNGAGLSIAIADDSIWNLVNAACLFLYDVPGARSCTLENGWVITLERKRK